MTMRQEHDDRLRRREFLTRAVQAAAAVAASGSALAPRPARAGEGDPPRPSRISYFRNGEIHVTELGKPDGKPLTRGHMDFKPSWSRTGNMLVFFRRTKDDRETNNWKSAISIVNADGSGLHQLTDGTRTDFNPTWTRDGFNTPIWNRKNDRTGSFYVMQSKVGNQPGQEVALTDESYHTWAHSSLVDARILVACHHPTLGWGYYLMTRRSGPPPLFERIACALVPRGLLDRISVSPSEKQVCFEFQTGFKYTYPGRTLYIADFDSQQRTITNLTPMANEAGKPVWCAYPRWVDGEGAVIYQSSETGQNQLYVYRLADGSTRRVSTSARADYRYPHGEAAPC